MENAEFISKLNEYIRFVFDHEDEFVDFISSKGNDYSACKVYMFYMAGDRCYVVIVGPVNYVKYDLTIKTDDFINWVDKLKNDNNLGA